MFFSEAAAVFSLPATVGLAILTDPCKKDDHNSEGDENHGENHNLQVCDGKGE